MSCGIAFANDSDRFLNFDEPGAGAPFGLNVEQRPQPAGEHTALPDRHGAHQRPVVGAVRAPNAVVHGEGGTGSAGSPPVRSDPFPVVGVHELEKVFDRTSRSVVPVSASQAVLT